MPSIEELPEPDVRQRDAIIAPLDAFTREHGFIWAPQAMTIALLDHSGTIAGGAIGEMNWGWLHLRILSVAPELRGAGWGRRLLQHIERLAVERGCRNAWVDTFSFQARPFYERQGYRVFGTLDGFPEGHQRFFLTKPLAPARSVSAATSSGTSLSE